MSPEAAALLALAESIADGAAIDWAATEAHASAAERAVIRELRLLSNLAGLHRSLPVPGLVPAATLAHRSGDAPAIGSWAHLTLIERLGGGASGDVYRAWDRHLEREVALKLLRGDEAVDELAESRIAREGRLLARVRHPNVITVHGVAAHERRVGLWMDLVRGVTLEQQLTAHGPLSAREAALVGIDLCRALAAIHSAGLIHRDVKAQNVMREDGGRIVLMDLGTGRELIPDGGLAVSDLAGTPLYLAPELFSGGQASVGTDLYSVGVLLYRLVTGAFPVKATTMRELEAQHKNGAGIRLRDARADLPTPFVRVIDRAMAAEPSARYQSAGALEAALSAAALESSWIHTARADAPRSGHTPSVPAWRRRPWLAVALAAVLLLAIAIPTRNWLGHRTAAPAPVPGRVSLMAVLPFENLSTDPGEAYLASAVPMELTALLGHVGALKVVPWTFMRQFGSPGRGSLQEIAARTGADMVVEGAVQLVPGGAAGSRPVHVRVQVYTAATGGLIWSGSFERALGDFFALQSDIAHEITSRVHVVLAAREQALVSRSREVPAQAMEDYLTGRQQKDQMDINGARESFLRAIRSAPRFAEAYTGLSLCYTLESAYSLDVPASVALPRALEASNRAIALDAELPEAWAARAFARFALEGDWSAAESDFQRALQLGPESVDVLEKYSNFMTNQGRHGEAIEIARKAEERAPLSVGTSRQVAWAYYMARQFDNAIRQARQSLTIDRGHVPSRTVLARSLLFSGRFGEGISELESVGPGYDGMRAWAYAMAGRRDDALRLVTDMESRRSDRQVSAYEIALAYVALGDGTRAFEWLETAFRDHDSSLTELAVDPMLDPLRADPRFEAFRSRVEQRQ